MKLHPLRTIPSTLAATAAAIGLAVILATVPATAVRAQDAPAPADSSAAPAPDSASADVPADTSAAAPAVAASSAPAQPNARPAYVRKVRFVHESHNVVRSGPGENYSIVGVYPGKTAYPVIAKSGDWYNVRLSDTETGWVHKSLCKEFDDLSDLQFRPNPRLYSRTGSFLLSAYSGGYAFDRESNSFVLGGGLGYYVFDRVQVEAGLAWTHVHRPAEIVESLFDLSLEAENFHMLFYHVNANYELLPGRQMVPYLTAGVGSTIQRGETEPSFNYGGGTTVYLSRRTAVRWEIRDYSFDMGAKNARRSYNNIAFTLGSVVLF